MNKEQKDKQSFPGYPHYPANEDITNPQNGTTQINIVPGGDSEPHPSFDDSDHKDADVRPEEKEMLSAAFQNRDMEQTDKENALLDQTDEDGEPLNETEDHYGKTGSDLDVPGNEEDAASQGAGNEDEENNYYSLDNQEDELGEGDNI